MASKVICSSQPAAMGIHYHYYSLAYMLESQKKAGYQSIELYCASPHVMMTPEGIADRENLLRTLRHSGLKVACVTPDNCMGPWQYAASGEEIIEQCKRYFLHALYLAADLGCAQVACHSGWGLLDEERSEAWKRSLDFMDWYARKAECLGLTLVMETLRPEESNLVNNLGALKEYLDELGSSSVRPMIDTCAMSVAGEQMEDWFKVFGDKIAHMHFVDCTPYLHLAWGDGNRSLEHYMNVIHENNYRGYLTQELTDNRYFDDPADADTRCFQVLSRYMEQ